MRVCRSVKYLFQRIFRGWDDSETWSLDCTIAEFVLPRLKRFKELNIGFPHRIESPEKWDEILDKMIFALDKVTKQFDDEDWTEEDQRKIRWGLIAFGNYFRDLWW